MTILNLFSFEFKKCKETAKTKRFMLMYTEPVKSSIVPSSGARNINVHLRNVVFCYLKQYICFYFLYTFNISFSKCIGYHNIMCIYYVKTGSLYTISQYELLGFAFAFLFKRTCTLGIFYLHCRGNFFHLKPTKILQEKNQT